MKATRFFVRSLLIVTVSKAIHSFSSSLCNLYPATKSRLIAALSSPPYTFICSPMPMHLANPSSCRSSATTLILSATHSPQDTKTLQRTTAHERRAIRQTHFLKQYQNFAKYQSYRNMQRKQ